MTAKRKPYRNRAILDFARDQPCVHCGRNDGTTVAAHYSGFMAHEFGKGAGQKADDYCVAYVCHECHTTLDGYYTGNDEIRSADFMRAILKTIRVLLDAGVLK